MIEQQVAPTAATILMKRTLKAPVERVYRAWTDPAEVAKWLSPNERWTQPKLVSDLAPGGVRNLTMVHSDSEQFVISGNYVDVQPNKLISFTWKFHHMPEDEPASLVTVTFDPVPEGTELTLKHERIVNDEEKQNTEEGWTGCLDMLVKHIHEGYNLPQATVA